MTLAVVPVLVGPLQTLLALLPALLVALGTLLGALLTPRGMLRLVRFFWHQKLFTLLLVVVAFCLVSDRPRKLLFGRATPAQSAMSASGGHWPLFRGNEQRTGAVASPAEDSDGAKANEPLRDLVLPKEAILGWSTANLDEPESVFSTPTIAGNQLLVTTASGMSPFSPAGRGALVSLDIVTGRVNWRYAPDDFRATFCSPVVAEESIVFGEGLHLVNDARVTCLDLNGKLRWEFRTRSHVEATPCIAEGRVYVAAGGDGLYCLSLHEIEQGAPRVLWHLEGDDYPDCESSPLVSEGVVYFGLGEGGQALCAVDCATGQQRWKVDTPFPVFAPPTRIVLPDGTPRIVIGMGQGNFVQSADDLRDQKVQELQSRGAPEGAIDAIRSRYVRTGQIWAIHPATGVVDWKHELPDTVLGAIAAQGDSLYAACRDGFLYELSVYGEFRQRWNAHEPMVSSPAVTPDQLFVTTVTGRVIGLKRRTLEVEWDQPTGSGSPSYSSPTVAGPRVFVGTADEGVRCFPAQVPRHVAPWNHGWRGGVFDDKRLPERGALAWRADIEFDGDEPREVWPPAIVGPRSLVSALSIPLANESILAGWSANWSSEMPEASPLAWQRSLTGRIVLPPVITGGTVVVARTDTDEPSPAIVLTALSTADGADQWELATAGDEPLALAIDERLVFLQTRERVRAWRASDGTAVWQRPLATEDHGQGALALTQGVLLVLHNQHVMLLDAESGVPLGAETKLLAGKPGEHWLLSAAAERWQLLRVAVNELTVESFELVDGKRLEPLRLEAGWTHRRAGGEFQPLPPLREGPRWLSVRGEQIVSCDLSSAGDAATATWSSWCTIAEGETPATPFVAVGGRLFYLTEVGRLICVGGESP